MDEIISSELFSRDIGRMNIGILRFDHAKLLTSVMKPNPDTISTQVQMQCKIVSSLWSEIRVQSKM